MCTYDILCRKVAKKMDVMEAIRSRRSIRKFQQKTISTDVLKKLVDAGRLAPSGANLQPLEYLVVTDDSMLDKVFDGLNWAGYLADGTPKEGEKPTAYIVILANQNITQNYQIDVGLAAENIMLAAAAEGLGSCMLRNIKRYNLRGVMSVPNHLAIDSVIALGYPAEKSVVEELTDSVEYWNDDKDILHVPKRNLEDIVHFNSF